MMSYSNYGTRNQDFEVWGKSVVLPMAGKVVTVQRDVSILGQPDLIRKYKYLLCFAGD